VGGTLVGAFARRVADRLSNRRRLRFANLGAPHYAAVMNANYARLLALLSAIVTAAALRLVPHPPNFTPIGAMALFSGAYLGRRGLAFVAPLGALLLSDLVIGFYQGMATVYFSVVLIVLIGWQLTPRGSFWRVSAAALASSVLFYLVTNFGMWLFSGIYPRTLGGLEACYIAAIPFFQNTVAGDLVYTGLLFGGFALLKDAIPRLREARTPKPA
jgi:hypothetical protein